MMKLGEKTIEANTKRSKKNVIKRMGWNQNKK